jgi:excisionase family DNA binding protein
MANIPTSLVPLLSTAEVAKWLGVSPRTVCLWAECKEIPAVKLGRHWRFREEEVRGWIESGGSDRVNVKEHAF